MDYIQFFQALLALIFVLGLLLITLWMIKTCQQKGLSGKLGKCFKSGNKINLIEYRRIDAKNSAVVLEYDGEEFFILLGTNDALLLKQKETSAKVLPHD